MDFRFGLQPRASYAPPALDTMTLSARARPATESAGFWPPSPEKRHYRKLAFRGPGHSLFPVQAFHKLTRSFRFDMNKNGLERTTRSVDKRTAAPAGTPTQSLGLRSPQGRIVSPALGCDVDSLTRLVQNS